MDTFLVNLPEPVRALWAAVPNLKKYLHGFIDAGRRAWPPLTVSDEQLLGHLGTRCSSPPADGNPLATLDAKGFYLVCACLNGCEKALLEFENHYMPIAIRHFQSQKMSKADQKELEDKLRCELIFAMRGNGSAAKLHNYNGKGKLESYVSTVARRMTYDFFRKSGKEVPRLDAGCEHVEAALWASFSRSSLVTSEQRLAGAVDVQRFAPVFKQSFQETLAELNPEDRGLLRAIFRKNATLRQLSLPRATAHDRVRRSLSHLLSGVTARLQQRCNLSPAELQSLVRDLMSDIQLSLSRLLGSESISLTPDN